MIYYVMAMLLFEVPFKVKVVGFYKTYLIIFQGNVTFMTNS